MMEGLIFGTCERLETLNRNVRLSNPSKYWV